MDKVEGCKDELEGCEALANDELEGVHVIANGSQLHKKLQAKISTAQYFSKFVAGPLKIMG